MLPHLTKVQLFYVHKYNFIKKLNVALYFKQIIKFHLIGCTQLILHNFYLELCPLVEQTNITPKKNLGIIMCSGDRSKPCLKPK